VRRCRARPAPALRGRVSAAGPGCQPWGRRSPPPDPCRRRAPDPSSVSGGLGQPRVHLRLADSTNERARDLAGRGAPHGTLVTALEQTAGRGRQGRTWTAPPGRAILCSVVVRDPPRLLPLAAGVAVAEIAGRQAALKWPNDVLVDG